MFDHFDMPQLNTQYGDFRHVSTDHVWSVVRCLDKEKRQFQLSLELANGLYQAKVSWKGADGFGYDHAYDSENVIEALVYAIMHALREEIESNSGLRQAELKAYAWARAFVVPDPTDFRQTWAILEDTYGERRKDDIIEKIIENWKKA